MRLGLRDLRLQHRDLRLRHVLLVQRHLVILLRIVQRRGGNHAILRHARCPVIGALQQRHIRTFRIDLGALEVRLRALQVGLGSFQAGLGLLHLRLNLDLVELRQQLALLHAVAVVDQKLLHDAAGLRLHFDLGDRRDLAGRDHALGQIALFHFGELRRINLGAATRRRDHSTRNQQHDDSYHAAPNNQFATLLLIISVTVHKPPVDTAKWRLGAIPLPSLLCTRPNLLLFLRSRNYLLFHLDSKRPTLPLTHLPPVS